MTQSTVAFVYEMAVSGTLVWLMATGGSLVALAASVAVNFAGLLIFHSRLRQGFFLHPVRWVLTYSSGLLFVALVAAAAVEAMWETAVWLVSFVTTRALLLGPPKKRAFDGIKWTDPTDQKQP